MGRARSGRRWRGETARAGALIDRVLPDHPQPALLLFRAGRALQAAGQRDAAIARYRHALDRNPDRVEPRFFLGQLLLDAKRADEAVPHLQAAVHAGTRLDVAPFDLARWPRCSITTGRCSRSRARLNLAVALIQLGREAEARTRLREALAIRPDYPQARALAERLR